MSKSPISKIVIQTIKKNKWSMSFVLCILVAGIVASLIPPLVLERMVNHLTRKEAITISVALLYFISLVVSGLLDAGKEVVITMFGQKMIRGLRSEMCKKLKRLPTKYFIMNDAGNVSSRFVNDADAVDGLFSNGILSLFVDCCKVVSILAVIFVKSIGVGLLLLIITPLLMFFTRIVQKRMLISQMKNREAIGKVNHHIPETIANIRMIHGYGKEEYMEKRYERNIHESYEAMEKSNFYDAIYSPIIVVISAIVIAGMVILAANAGVEETLFGMSVGTTVAMIAYIGKIFDPLESIGMEIQNVQSAVAGMKRINEFLMEEERQVGQLDAPVFNANAQIQFENVTFSYNDNERVLDQLSFSIKSESHAVFQGRTGSGKSTVFRLILGLFSPKEGRVLIGEVEASKIKESQKRKLFGYVEQNFHLVSGTIAQQISLFDQNITKEQIIEAAITAGIHESIMKLPKGYETIATNNLFSKGEMQLLSIARAVVSKPAILLLDEITANLDVKTEQRVERALEEASKNRTVISISHRKNKIRPDEQAYFF